MQRWLAAHWTAQDGAYTRFGFANLKESSELIDSEGMKYNIVFEGDSRSVGDVHYPDVVASLMGIGTLYSNYTSRYYNVGASGETTDQMVTERATQIDPYYDAAYDYNMAVIWAGTNDASADGHSTVENLQTWCEACQALGFITVVLTEAPKGPEPNQFMMVNRPYINAALLAAPTWADIVVDSGNDVRLDLSDASVYKDNVHLTTWGYANIIAPAVYNAIIDYCG